MTLLDLAKRYPSMRKILLRNRQRVLRKEMELRRRQAEEAPSPFQQRKETFLPL